MDLLSMVDLAEQARLFLRRCQHPLQDLQLVRPEELSAPARTVEAPVADGRTLRDQTASAALTEFPSRREECLARTSDGTGMLSCPLPRPPTLLVLLGTLAALARTHMPPLRAG
jgi:hypothetical protein